MCCVVLWCGGGDVWEGEEGGRGGVRAREERMKGRRGDVRSCMLVSNSPPSSQPHVPETLCIGVTFGLDESRAPAAPQRRSDIFFILVMGGRRELVATAKDASTSSSWLPSPCSVCIT